MNAEQKRAWFAIVTFVGCIIAYFILLPSWGPGPATVAFGLFGINIFAFFFRKRRDRSRVAEDERDKGIDRRATAIGGMASYSAFVLACMGTWFVVFALGRKEQISVHILGSIVVLGCIVLFVVRSVALLVFYGRSGETDNG